MVYVMIFSLFQARSTPIPKQVKSSKARHKDSLLWQPMEVGMLIGFWVAGQITDTFAQDGGHAWESIWLFPAAFALLVFVIFAFAF